MGLDMYLEVEQYISDHIQEDKVLAQSIKDKAPYGLSEFSPKKIVFELAYWRKANAIHGWFIRNIQDGIDNCQRTYVPTSALQELKNVCEKVLKDITLANKLLPVTKGFFFGDYSYDEYYERDLQYTVNILDKFLKNPDIKKLWVVYHSSW
jgi:hypothetical protein